MNELQHLTSMWSDKTKRSTDLIVPKVTYLDRQGSLNNEFWSFKVSYAFRDALDIKNEERKKNKKAYRVWTQGPFLSFKEGDLIHSNDGRRTVQINIAKEMSWDKSKGEMYQGSVTFSEHTISDDSITKISEQTCTQMQFLELLINGTYHKSTL
jgi:hypothetical protein